MARALLNQYGTNIDELRYHHSVLKAEVSLHEFLKQAWPNIVGNIPFIDNWHIQAICEHLEAVAERQIRNLLINIPPRCAKSSIISVAFNAWRWISCPVEKFVCSSYVVNLARRDTNATRRLINSQWYQERWGHIYKLKKDQNTKTRFDNDQNGYRATTSSASATTGDGGSIIIADDPNNALDAVSDAFREKRIDWWTAVWPSRLNNQKEDCKIVVQQRIHEQDISGYITSHDDLNEWTKLILPMEFESKRRSSTIVLPSTNGKIWEDPRTEENELLWPERFDEKILDSLKHTQSQYVYAGQYQQRPSPEEGGIIKKSWFKWWKDSIPPEIIYVVQSWDTALTAKEMSAFSACTTWGVFHDHNHVENLILLSSWRGKLEYPELRKMAKRLYNDYRDTGKEHNPKFIGRDVDLCLVEAKATGDPLIQDLLIAGIRATPFNPTKYGDKIARVRYITHLIESGLVWLPAKPKAYDTLLPYADEFLEAVSCFPNADSRDLVDTMTQTLIRLKLGRFLQNPKDEQFVLNNNYKEKNIY